MTSNSTIMREPNLLCHSPLSPHRLFQELWQAVEANDCSDAQRLVEALIHMLAGNQILAHSAIMELIGFAGKRKCCPEIVQLLARLPGFKAPVKPH